MGRRIKGILKQWNDDKGYGFIEPLGSKEKVFAHISKFQRISRRPQVGDKLIFEIITENSGKRQAVTITGVEDAVMVQRANKIPHPESQSRSSRRIRHVLIIGVLGVCVVLGHQCTRNQTYETNKMIISQPIEKSQFIIQPIKNTPAVPLHQQREDKPSQFIIQPKKSTPSTVYQCDGRQYCSQMHSCEEAKYFIRHCLHTKMDGDGDGVPCEQQWCR